MVYSFKTICVWLLAVAVLCGCSQSDDVTASETREATEQETPEVVFRLTTSASSSPTTRSAEDSYVYVQGTADEYRVTKVRVYFYDTSTKLFAKSILLTNLTRTGSDSNGNVIYESEHVAVPQGTFDIFVTANTDRQINKETEMEFLADVDSMTYVRGIVDDVSGGIVMTNRATENLGTVIVKRQGYADNVIGITLERVLARLDIAKSAESFPLTETNGRKYASVTLDGYYIVNLPKYYYSFRHTAVLSNLTEPEWKISENFGNVSDVNGYVIDPYFFKKKINAADYSNADKYYVNFLGDYANPRAVTWTPFKPVVDQPQYTTVYCLENCALAPAQKNGYSTGVFFRATLEPNNNVYHLASGGELVLVTDKSNYPEVLYYYNYNFYDSPEALAAAAGVASVTSAEFETLQTRKFEKSDDGYRCYYIYWIRHLDNFKDTEMGVMEFGIVRNNLYRMLVTNVSGLGYQDPVINPDIPDEGETFLKVMLSVKPWIVRDLTDIVL